MAEYDDEPDLGPEAETDVAREVREAMCEAVGMDLAASYASKAFEAARWELESLWYKEVFGTDPKHDVARLRAALKTMRPFRKSLRMLGYGWGKTDVEGDDFGKLVEFLRAAIDRLEPLLVATIRVKDEEAKFRPLGARGRGRPPKKRTAYTAAEIAARFFLDFTGTLPTYSTEGTTPFKRMLEGLFRAIGIKADTRRPAEWAIGQITLKSLSSAT